MYIFCLLLLLVKLLAFGKISKLYCFFLIFSVYASLLSSLILGRSNWWSVMRDIIHQCVFRMSLKKPFVGFAVLSIWEQFSCLSNSGCINWYSVTIVARRLVWISSSSNIRVFEQQESVNSTVSCLYRPSSSCLLSLGSSWF